MPGITAMQDLAARSGAVLTEGTEPLTLVPVTAGSAVLKDALDGPGTVVAYKFGRQAREVAEALRETGRIDDAVWGSALGLDEESIRPAADLDGEPRCRTCRRSSRPRGATAAGAGNCEPAENRPPGARGGSRPTRPPPAR